MLSKSHSFLVKKANGTDDFMVQLRASYCGTIKSEKKLRDVLEKSFNQDGKNASWYQAMKTNHYDKGDVLFVLRQYGMIAGSERVTK